MNFPKTLFGVLTGLLLAMPNSGYSQSVLPDDYEEEEYEEEEAEDEEEVGEEEKYEEDEEEYEEEEEEEQDEEDEEEDDRMSAEERAEVRAARRANWVIKNRRQSSGLGFELSVGGLGVYRRMSFAGTDREIKHRPGPFFGGVIKVTQTLLTMKKSKSHFLVEAEGGFGSAKNVDVEPALGRPLVNEHAYFHAVGIFQKPIHPDVDLRLGLGIGASSFTIEPNPDYTGHRYLSLIALVGADYWTSDRIRVGGDLVFFPGIDTNQSAGGYGAAQSFGGRGDAHLIWRFLQPEEDDLFGSADLVARYAFTRFHTAMPETQALGDLAGTDDTQHSLVLLLSYHL